MLRRQIIGIVLVTLIISSLFTPPAQMLLKLPAQLKVEVGETVPISPILPPNLLEKIVFQVADHGNKDDIGILSLNGSAVGRSFKPLQGNPVALKPGSLDLELKLFGVIPLKRMVVTVARPSYVVPGGQSIGIFVNDSGILVRDYSNVINKAGISECPAKKTGILPGDVILESDGVKVSNEWELAENIDQAGRENRAVDLLIERNNKTIKLKVNPIYCQQNRRFRIGLLVKDNTAGVGTMTFYEPESQTYGALGHVIVDSATNRAQEIKRGKIVPAPIQGVEPGKKGKPGEKIGIFQEEKGTLGSIDYNNQYGIYGQLSQKISNPIYPKPIPVGWTNQIQTGPASILTVINDESIEEFAINIEKVFNDQTGGKGIIIKVTDPRLLELTGGIIQGMSGSPVIQEGRLIGAVTHVFINDPTRGYALSAEYMIEFIRKQTHSAGAIPGFFMSLTIPLKR